VKEKAEVSQQKEKKKIRKGCTKGCFGKVEVMQKSYNQTGGRPQGGKHATKKMKKHQGTLCDTQPEKTGGKENSQWESFLV